VVLQWKSNGQLCLTRDGALVAGRGAVLQLQLALEGRVTVSQSSNR
jgi:hypothetical protein